MTTATELSIPCSRRPRRSPWARAALALLTPRLGRRNMVAPDRWSRHMLRDIGLTDYESGEPLRSIVTTATGWPIR